MPAEKTEMDMFKSKAPEKDTDTAAHAAEAVERALQQQHPVVGAHPPRRAARTRPRMRGQALPSAPKCRSSATSNAAVQRRSTAASKASCAPPIFSSAR